MRIIGFASEAAWKEGTQECPRANGTILPAGPILIRDRRPSACYPAFSQLVRLRKCRRDGVEHDSLMSACPLCKP
jgi:hypothetical protein